MKLVDCFIPFFALVRHHQRQPVNAAITLAEQLDSLITKARRDANDAGFVETDIEEALFAAVSWADEMLIATQWSGATEWQSRLLQRRYFRVSNAGVAFFTHLENLNAQQLAVREVYYLCLGMGFAGRYGYDRNQKALTDIKQTNLALLLEDEDGLPGAAGRLMFPDGYGALLTDDVVPQPARRRFWRFSLFSFNTMLIPLLVLLVLYGIYHVIIWQLVDAILPQIKI